MVGSDNDYYLNLTTGDVFKKLLGSWAKVGNIKGPIGDSHVVISLDEPSPTYHGLIWIRRNKMFFRNYTNTAWIEMQKV